MRAVNGGRIGQGGITLHGRKHLRGGALKQPATAHREQRVADENHRRIGQVKADMACGVRGRFHHHRFMGTQHYRVPFRHEPVGGRDAGGLRGRGDDRDAVRGLKRCIAAGVIGVPVRVPDRAQPPAARCQRCLDRSGLCRVDHDCLARGAVMGEPDVIVGQRRDAHNLDRHHQCPVLGIDAQGSCGGKWPSCNSSIEILSGLRTNAM